MLERNFMEERKDADAHQFRAAEEARIKADNSAAEGAQRRAERVAEIERYLTTCNAFQLCRTGHTTHAHAIQNDRGAATRLSAKKPSAYLPRVLSHCQLIKQAAH